jgi:ubiquitin carboxyl-terminal hydrolase 9/24
MEQSYQERKGHAAVNANKNRWFKFNDTTVEEIVMTDETLEAECFGGKFKVRNLA